MAETTIAWKHLVGQERAKELLGLAFSAGSLGHSYLFCGEEGVGKFAAALDLAMALLCTSGDGPVPCHACSSCRKIMNNNHPDLHIVLPLPFEKEYKTKDENDLEIFAQKGWDFISSNTLRKIHAPYLPLSFGKETNDEKGDRENKTSFKIPTIPVCWIRELKHKLLRGSVAGERSVAIFFDIDEMEAPSANALLKILEEPPANTYMVLTTCKPKSVLPTVVSRCQIIRFGHVPPQQIEEQLSRALGPSADKDLVRRAVHYSMGSLGRALALIESEEPKTLQEAARDVEKLWDLCHAGDWLKIASHIDELSRERNYAVHEQFLTSMLYLIRNSFLRKNGCSESYIDAGDILSDPDGVFSRQDGCERLTRACNDALSSVKANGNIAIILVNFVITVMEILHGEKQQTG